LKIAAIGNYVYFPNHHPDMESYNSPFLVNVHLHSHAIDICVINSLSYSFIDSSATCSLHIEVTCR
jgi:pterin-4a-carbinolamine dehydratase